MGAKMKIKSVQIENLRSFENVKVPFNDYTCLVGPNGAGKSTILCALNIFFRENNGSPTDLTLLQEEDFHQKDVSKPIRITVTFSDLNEEAQKDFADYYRHGELTVSAVAKFNRDTKQAEVKQYGVRLGMREFSSFFEADGNKAKVQELKDVYEKIRIDFPELPESGTRESMKRELQKFESSRPDLCIPLESEDQFYGISKGINRLERHVQWVYVPAVKDATSEQVEARNTALGKLLSRAVNARTEMNQRVSDLRDELRKKYQELLDANAGVLDEISSALRRRIVEWAHPDASVRLLWRNDPEKSVKVEEPLAKIIAGEYGFEGELSRFGHGMQRSYLLALLHELASIDGSVMPRLLLGCEEPELYQHPPQARYLASVLQRLSQSSAQIIITSHSPLFINGATFEDVRMVRKSPDSNRSSVSHAAFSAIAKEYHEKTGAKLEAPKGTMAKLHQILLPHINEMFFCHCAFLVEGIEDVAYINSYLSLSGRIDEFRSAGVHVIPVNKKSEMIRPYLISKVLGVRTFIMFDADTDTDAKNVDIHKRDNRILLKLSGNDSVSEWPGETFWGDNVIMWQYQLSKALDGDVTDKSVWQSAKQQAEKEYGHVGGLDKNVLAIGAKLSAAWDSGEKFPVLEKVVSAVLAYARRSSKDVRVIAAG